MNTNSSNSSRVEEQNEDVVIGDDDLEVETIEIDLKSLKGFTSVYKEAKTEAKKIRDEIVEKITKMNPINFTETAEKPTFELPSFRSDGTKLKFIKMPTNVTVFKGLMPSHFKTHKCLSALSNKKTLVNYVQIARQPTWYSDLTTSFKYLRDYILNGLDDLKYDTNKKDYLKCFLAASQVVCYKSVSTNEIGKFLLNFNDPMNCSQFLSACTKILSFNLRKIREELTTNSSDIAHFGTFINEIKESEFMLWEDKEIQAVSPIDPIFTLFGMPLYGPRVKRDLIYIEEGTILRDGEKPADETTEPPTLLKLFYTMYVLAFGAAETFHNQYAALIQFRRMCNYINLINKGKISNPNGVSALSKNTYKELTEKFEIGTDEQLTVIDYYINIFNIIAADKDTRWKIRTEGFRRLSVTRWDRFIISFMCRMFEIDSYFNKDKLVYGEFDYTYFDTTENKVYVCDGYFSNGIEIYTSQVKNDEKLVFNNEIGVCFLPHALEPIAKIHVKLIVDKITDSEIAENKILLDGVTKEYMEKVRPPDPTLTRAGRARKIELFKNMMDQKTRMQEEKKKVPVQHVVTEEDKKLIQELNNVRVLISQMEKYIMEEIPKRGPFYRTLKHELRKAFGMDYINDKLFCGLKTKCKKYLNCLKYGTDEIDCDHNDIKAFIDDIKLNERELGNQMGDFLEDCANNAFFDFEEIDFEVYLVVKFGVEYEQKIDKRDKNVTKLDMLVLNIFKNMQLVNEITFMLIVDILTRATANEMLGLIRDNNSNYTKKLENNKAEYRKSEEIPLELERKIRKYIKNNIKNAQKNRLSRRGGFKVHTDESDLESSSGEEEENDSENNNDKNEEDELTEKMSDSSEDEKLVKKKKGEKKPEKQPEPKKPPSILLSSSEEEEETVLEKKKAEKKPEKQTKKANDEKNKIIVSSDDDDDEQSEDSDDENGGSVIIKKYTIPQSFKDMEQMEEFYDVHNEVVDTLNELYKKYNQGNKYSGSAKNQASKKYKDLAKQVNDARESVSLSIRNYQQSLTAGGLTNLKTTVKEQLRVVKNILSNAKQALVTLESENKGKRKAGPDDRYGKKKRLQCKLCGTKLPPSILLNGICPDNCKRNR